jgi:hypothetical protein
MCIYDPQVIISTKRMKNGLFPYQRQLKPQLERISNQYSWEDVQRILQIQEHNSNLPSQSPFKETPQNFEKTYKRKVQGSIKKMSELEGEKSNKKQKIEEHAESEIQIEKHGSNLSKIDFSIVIEVLS